MAELRPVAGSGAAGLLHLRPNGTISTSVVGLKPGGKYVLAMTERLCGRRIDDPFFFDLGAELAATARGTIAFRRGGFEVTGPDRSAARNIALRRASDDVVVACGRLVSMARTG